MVSGCARGSGEGRSSSDASGDVHRRGVVLTTEDGEGRRGFGGAGDVRGGSGDGAMAGDRWKVVVWVAMW